jgi:iron complex transport system permease protein
LFLLAMMVLLVLSLFLAVSIGSVNIPFGTVWRVVWDHLPGVDGASQPERQDAIIWNFRVPRALLAAVVGGSLSVAGAALQAAVRNPLAEPYVLGVVQGASFGAVLTIAIGSAAVGGLALSAAAFAGAMVSLTVLLLLGRRRGKVEPVRLVLAGVAIGELFYAGTSYLQVRMSDGNSLAGVLFWLLGTVAAASWDDLGIPTIVLCPGGWSLNPPPHERSLRRNGPPPPRGRCRRHSAVRRRVPVDPAIRTCTPRSAEG